MPAPDINSTPALFYYVTEVDLAADNAPGVNERGFVSTLSAIFPDKFVCFAPKPTRSSAQLFPGVRHVAGHRGLHPIFFLAYQVDLLRALVKTARQRRPDAIVVRAGIFPLVPLIFARWLDIPIFVKTLGMGALTTLPKRFFPIGKYILSPMVFWIYSKLLDRASVIDTVSATYIDWAMQTFGIQRERFRVIANGVDVGLFSPQSKDQARVDLGLSRSSRVVGFIGSLDPWYNGVDRIINVSSSILQRNTDTIFVIVGDGRERHRLEDLAKERGVRDKFLFKGHVPHDSVVKYINAFDIATILWPSERMQKTGSSAMKLREYLACGCPVVASRGDGHEFIEENGLGWLVIPEDPEQVYNAICTGLNLTSEEMENICKRAREYAVVNLSIETLARRRYKLWLEIIKNG